MLADRLAGMVSNHATAIRRTPEVSSEARRLVDEPCARLGQYLFTQVAVLTKGVGQAPTRTKGFCR